MSPSGNEEHPAVQPGSAASRRPGHELGAARERAGISLEEMATRLNLGRDSVEALERDDYEHLPTAAFVRGYLRAYAKEVGMDGDALVAEFDAVSDRTDAPELVVSEGVPDPGSGHGPTVAILILVAVVIIGAGAWWLQQPAGTPPADQAETTSTVTGGGDGDAVETDADGETSSPDGDGDTDGQTEAESDVGTESGTSTEPGSGDTEAAEADGVVSESTDRDVQASSGAEMSAQDAAETENVVAEAPETAEENGLTETSTGEQETDGPLATSDADLAASDAAETGPDRLEIRVEGESWLEIYDSRGRRLAYTLYSGSAPVVVNGWAPFDVYLGNAPDVTVEFGDTAIDPSPFVRSDNTARFLADSEGARSR